eukprot:m51a1_g11932 hypothetical protein (405) ;mRNA; r:707154-708529
MQDFVRWMRESGFGVHPSVRLGPTPGTGRGAFTVSALERGTELFRVPVALLLGPASPHCRLGRLLRASRLSPWEALIACLMSEASAGPSSAWAPFLSALPRDVDTPLFWSPRERQELGGTETEAALGAEAIRRAFAERVEPFVRAHQSHFSRENSGLDAYVFWGSVAMSRAFDSHPDYDGPVMTPMADMLNHKTGHCNAHLEDHGDGSGSLPMVLQSAVPAGGELFNTYGDLGNSELLRRYGYADDVNPFNTVDVPLSCVVAALPEGTARAYARIAAVKGNLGPRSHAIRVGGDLPRALVEAAAACALPGDGLQSYRRSRELPAGARESQRTKDLLEKAIRMRLAKYPTSLDQDKKLLNSIGNVDAPDEQCCGPEVKPKGREDCLGNDEVLRPWALRNALIQIQ